MTKLDGNTKIVIFIVINLLFVGSFRSYEIKTVNLQISHSEQSHGSMNNPIDRLNQETLAVHSSGIILEDSNEFLAGTMDDLTIDNDNSVRKNKDLTS